MSGAGADVVDGDGGMLPDGPSGLVDWLSGLRRRVNIRDYGVLLCLIAMCVFIAARSDRFLTTQNLLNLIDQNTSVGIIACAGTLVFIAGGFDLSVGAIFALSGAVTVQVSLDHGATAGIACALGVGALCGLFNGAWITAGGVNPFIATLASAFVFTGLVLWVIDPSKGLVEGSLHAFDVIARDKFLGVLYSTWIFLIFAVTMGLLLHRTLFGRQIYAVGANREAARLSGIRVKSVITTTFVLSGFAAALAGMMYISRVKTPAPDLGFGLDLGAVAAIVVGGTSIGGGQGAMWRTIVGVFFIGVIGNGFNLLGWDPLYQQIVQGAIILLAVAADARMRQDA